MNLHSQLIHTLEMIERCIDTSSTREAELLDVLDTINYQLRI